MQHHPPTKIFLARHGQSVWNGTQRVSGQLDPLLSRTGAMQAKALCQVLQDEPLARIYTSTLGRTIETARPTADFHEKPIQQETALKEIHHGILQGRFRDERDPEAQRLWAARANDVLSYRIAEGETFSELEQRVVPCLQAILKKENGGVVLIVGHRNTNRVILGFLMAWPLEQVATVKLRNKYLYEITPGCRPRIRTIALDDKKQGKIYDRFRT